MWLEHVDFLASELCDIYPITCECCNNIGHFNFQCIHNPDPVEAKYYYNKGFRISLELIEEFTLYVGCKELLEKITMLKN